MELRTLRYFLAVAESGSVTRASEKLYITQPTVSRQIADLEDSLGVKLFNRDKHRLSLTSEGILLKHRAKEILELATKTQDEISIRKGAVEGIVSIGTGDLSALKALPKLIKEFLSLYPKVHFDFYTGSADLIEERIEEGLADIGIFLEPTSIEKFEFLRLEQKEVWCAIMSPQNPLAKKQFITPIDLKDERLVLPRRQNVHSEVAHWFGKFYKDLKICFTTNLHAPILPLIKENVAISIGVRGSSEMLDKNDVVIRPLEPPFESNAIIAWKRNTPLGIATRKLIAFLVENLNS